jgi:tripartite-type tricarboxylate transporter receptor subunit TctC
MREPPYDPRRDLVPLAKVGAVPMVLVTSGKSGIANFEQLKAFVGANPQRATYVSSGIGSPGQVYMEMLKAATGLAVREIPYANPSQGQVDVTSGEVLISMMSLPAAKPHLQGGVLRLLAVGALHRLPEYPQAPTMAELAGRPDFEAAISYALFAPAGTPPDVVNELYIDLQRAYQRPQLQRWLAQNDVVGSLTGPQEFNKWLQQDLAGMAKLVRTAKLAAGELSVPPAVQK